MTKPGQDPEEQKLRLDAETIKDLSPREDESAELKGGGGVSMQACGHRGQ